jgi:hypothetical protein
VLGTNHQSVGRDTSGPSGPEPDKTGSKNKGVSKAGGPDGPAALSGTEAAKAVESKENKDERKAAKQEARNQREAELAARQLALPQKRYGVIGADPEWKFETWSEAGMDRSADIHYPTSATGPTCRRMGWKNGCPD